MLMHDNDDDDDDDDAAVLVVICSIPNIPPYSYCNAVPLVCLYNVVLCFKEYSVHPSMVNL